MHGTGPISGSIAAWMKFRATVSIEVSHVRLSGATGSTIFSPRFTHQKSRDMKAVLSAASAPSRAMTPDGRRLTPSSQPRTAKFDRATSIISF